MRTCSIENCELKHKAKGLCNKHYRKSKYKIKAKSISFKKCSIIGCERNGKNRGICIYHHRRTEEFKIYSNNWKKQNREKQRIYDKKYSQSHLKKRNSDSAKRRAQKLKATPKWADLKAIEEFYKNCPTGYHVDHIIPLKGKNVNGLHVLNNLQYLPAIENMKKGNKFE